MVAYKSLTTKEKSSWVIPLLVAVDYGSGRLRELFITKFKLQFKWDFAKAVVTRAGRLKCLWNEKCFVLIWKAFQNTEEWRFSFWNIFFRFRDIEIFLLCSDDVIRFATKNWKILNKRCLWKYWSSVLETWHHKFASKKKRNDTLNAVAIATISAPVSFCQKTKYPHFQPLKWDRGSYLEQT